MNHEKMMGIIHDVFSPSMPRLGPGDDHSTRRGLEILLGPGLEGVGPDFRALDVGCGNGAQTLRLAADLGCRVTAVDNHQPYLDELRRRAQALGLADRIETRCADMNGLDLAGQTFDLVWAEGSSFIMGVPEALRAWRQFLKPGGALGFSELTWFEEDPPAECRDFFAAISPQMGDVAAHLASIKKCGFELVDWFTLPESSWWGPLYDPLAERLPSYQPPDDDEETLALVDMFSKEIEMYRRFSRWYGYGFFLMRKFS